MKNDFPVQTRSFSTFSDWRLKFVYGSISIVILFFLIFQAIVTFRVVCPPLSIPQLSHLRVLCAPALFPFLDYPMYKEPHYQGEKIHNIQLFGILDDYTEVQINPEDLNMNFWMFEVFLFAIDQEQHEDIHFYATMYEEMHRKNLIFLRLEDNPYILRDKGLFQGQPEVLKEYSLDEK
jgi:hypothetical protein